MTIRQAIIQRIKFVRLREWDERACLELPLLPAGGYGPWAIIHDYAGQENIKANGLGETKVLITELLKETCDRYEIVHPTNLDKR